MLSKLSSLLNLVMLSDWIVLWRQVDRFHVLTFPRDSQHGGSYRTSISRCHQNIPKTESATQPKCRWHIFILWEQQKPVSTMRYVRLELSLSSRFIHPLTPYMLTNIHRWRMCPSFWKPTMTPCRICFWTVSYVSGDEQKRSSASSADCPVYKATLDAFRMLVGVRILQWSLLQLLRLLQLQRIHRYPRYLPLCHHQKPRWYQKICNR